jgi:hypothetical protein
VQLIDASAFWLPMRKSLGDKRRETPPDKAQDIVRLLTEFKDGETRCITKDGKVTGLLCFDQDLRFAQRVEDLAVQQLVAQLAVEALAVAILPRAAGRDVQRLRAELVEPLAQLRRHHLRTVVRADASGRHDRQRLLRVLVDQRQDLDWPAIVSPIHHEVPAPLLRAHQSNSLSPARWA